MNERGECESNNKTISSVLNSFEIPPFPIDSSKERTNPMISELELAIVRVILVGEHTEAKNHPHFCISKSVTGAAAY